MVEVPGGESGGLFPALKNIVATLLAGGRTRLALLSNEIEVAKLRALRVLLLAQGMLFCFGLALVLAIALLTAIFWEQRIAVLTLSMFLFLGMGSLCLIALRFAARSGERLFSASLGELDADLRRLHGTGDDEPPSR